jgi:prepilin-type N-terminal cleavage/methylation domain-containing protein
MKLRHITRQAGFTLVEIAIVLVIIGVLLVGVLQGQEMIENSKIKSVANDMKAIQVAYNGYLDRYKAMPGDEPATTMTNRGWPGTGGATAVANGLLAAAPGAATFAIGAATEHEGFWRALRGAGLLSGDPAALTTAAHPRHAFGGVFGMASNPAPAAPATPTVLGLPGVSICANGLTTKQAAALDVLIDGPLPASQIGNSVGNLRASTAALAGPTPTGLAYNETTTTVNWNVCWRIA